MLQAKDKFEATSDDIEQEMHQGAMQRQFCGRAKLLVKAVEMVEQIWNKGGLMWMEGEPGEGKTVFMVKLIFLNFCLVFFFFKKQTIL